MKIPHKLLLSSLVAALVAAGAGLATASQDDEGGLQKITRDQSEAQEATRWREALSADDLERREEAFERLVAEARQRPELYQTLQTWAQEEGELAWTSRLALRELRQRGAGRGPQAFPGPFGQVPDWFRSPWQGFPDWTLPGDDAFPGNDLFRDMEDGLRKLFEERPFGLPDGGQGAGPGAGSSSSAESYRMESGPDGVRVEVRTNENGEESVKTYEAPSVEELYELYPELSGKLPLAQPFSPDTQDRLRGLFDRLQGWMPNRLHDEQVQTDRLGVLMRPPGQWSASVEGIDPGVGLFVERTFPGTLADALGIRPGDIVIALNGTPLKSADDVRGVLERRGPKDEVQAEIVDRRGARRTLRWSPPEKL